MGDFSVSDHRIVAELMESNKQFGTVAQLKGMLDNLARIQSYLVDLLIAEANKKKA